MEKKYYYDKSLNYNDDLEYKSIRVRRYYDTSILQRLLESVIGKSIEEIEIDIEHATVYLDEERIKKLLNALLDEKKENVKSKRKNGEYTAKANSEAERAFDRMIEKGYTYDDEKYEYYQKYLLILTRKLTTILNIIKAITVRETKEVEEQLEDLDIELLKGRLYSTKGLILGSDILRLVKPFEVMYRELINKTEEANTIESYKTHIFDRRLPLSNTSHYPCEELQARSEYVELDEPGFFIPLTKKQKVLIRERLHESSKKGAKIVGMLN